MKALRRIAVVVLLTAVLAYAGICAMLLVAQNRLLYIGTTLPPHPASIAFAPFNDANGTQIGWLAAPAGPARGTIVYFHGNAEEAWQAEQNYAPYFTSRGWRVVFPEYRGFDFRPGQPTHGNTIADAIATAQLAAQRYPGTLWIAGNSLGAGIAAQAARPAGVARVLLFVPWDSMGAVAQERYPFVPTRLLLAADGTDYDSCTALAGLTAPIFITYAALDDIIPAHHAQNLARCLAVPPAQLYNLPQATHLDWYKKLSPAQWDALLATAP